MEDEDEKHQKFKIEITMARKVFLTSAETQALQSPPNGGGYFFALQAMLLKFSPVAGMAKTN